MHHIQAYHLQHSEAADIQYSEMERNSW